MNKKDKQNLEKDLRGYIGNEGILKHAIETLTKRIDGAYYKGRTDRNEELKIILKTKTIMEFDEFIHKKVLREER